MADAAISVRNVSKRYEVFESQRARLLNAFVPGYRNGMQEIRALEDVSFEIARGESVGVIGRNGSGKSTLLQILAGTLTPSAGEVTVRGRVSALLELGSGFNPEYTGRDNVFINGLLLGLTRGEILSRFDEIVAFAEIGEALDRPVRTYSSGMMMRLAFAVQVLTDPEILIIDEALSVGDFFFQQKCFAHIRSLRSRDVTVILVSHDTRSVRDLCERSVYLKQGRVEFTGDSSAAIRRYLAEPTAGPTEATAVIASTVVAETAGGLPKEAFWRRAEGQPGRPLLAVEILGSDGMPATRVEMGDKLRFRVYFRADADQAGHVALVIKNRYDQIASSNSSYSIGSAPLSSKGSDFAIYQFDIGMMLEAGHYSFKVAFARPTGKNLGELVDETGWIGPIAIDWDYEREKAPFLGMFGLPVRGELLSGRPWTTASREAE